MSFGNVPRDLNLSSLSSLRSIASKSTNGYFSADLRTVGSLVQYQRSPGVWVTADASLTVPATQLGDLYTLPYPGFSFSLSFDASTLAVGLKNVTPGNSILSILTNTAGFYVQETIPIPPDAVVATQGIVSLSNDGNILALGSDIDNNNVGAVWIYAKIAGVWTLQGPKITGPGEIGAGSFGLAVSLSGSGNLLVVGSPFETPAGAAYIFNLNSPSSPQFVARLVGTPLDTGAVFGYDVAFSADGSTLAVGASSNLANKGSAFVFTKIQSQWTQQAFLTPPSGFTTQYFGFGVSLSANGNIFAASSVNNAVVYYRSALADGLWSAGNVLPLPYDFVNTIADYYAYLSHDGNTICTGSYSNNNNVGASWIFTQGPIGTWTQNGPALVGTGATLPATRQGYPRISGNGKVLAVLDYSDQGFLWIFV
jgi:hypothetical protein